MNCIMCKSKLTAGVVNHIVDINGHIIIIKNVPANVCKQCGEYFVENDIAIKLEQIVEEAEKSKAEVTIINFYEKVA